MQQLLQNGAGVKLLINGAVIGFATGINFTRSINTKYIYGIDSPIAQEIAPTTYSVQGGLTGIRIRGTGGLDGYGVMDLSSVRKYFEFKYAILEVVDRKTNVTIYTIKDVVFDSDSWSMQARQLIGFSANFKGKFVFNEVSNSKG